VLFSTQKAPFPPTLASHMSLVCLYESTEDEKEKCFISSPPANARVILDVGLEVLTQMSVQIIFRVVASSILLLVYLP
jgi:hypothetical protein